MRIFHLLLLFSSFCMYGKAPDGSISFKIDDSKSTNHFWKVAYLKSKCAHTKDTIYWDKESRRLIMIDRDTLIRGIFENEGKVENLLEGEYKIVLSSDFGDTWDTLIFLKSGMKKLSFDMSWYYKFNDDIPLIIKMRQRDTLKIFYERKYCCGGVCCVSKDEQHITIGSEGKYKAYGFEHFFNDNCLGSNIPGPKWVERKLSHRQISLIEDFEKINKMKDDLGDQHIKECVIKVGRTVALIKRDSYPSLRKALFGE